MAKYKLCGGLAITPERDTKLLKEMSKKGWHLVGMKGIVYRFEEGEPCHYDYTFNAEMKIDKDMLSFYEASGWHPVVISQGYQIFRAKEGTTPIFTDRDSEEEVLQRNQKMNGMWAIVFGILLVIGSIVSKEIDLGLITVTVMIAFYICFVYTFLPFVGYSRSLMKIRKNN